MTLNEFGEIGQEYCGIGGRCNQIDLGNILIWLCNGEMTLSDGGRTTPPCINGPLNILAYLQTRDLYPEIQFKLEEYLLSKV
jgi:hypothetical protein